MASLGAIRDELAEALNTPEFPWFGHRPDMVHAGIGVIDPFGIDFRTTFGPGTFGWTILAKAILGTAGGSTAADLARDEFFGGINDIYSAIVAHDYGSVAENVQPIDARRFDALQIDDQVYFGVEIQIEVIA